MSGSWPSSTRPRFAGLDVGELHAAVADWATAVLVEDRSGCAHFGVDGDAVTLEQAFVATAIADDLDVGMELCVALNESADCGGEAGGEATCCEDGNFLDGLCFSHVDFVFGLKCC